MEESTKELRFLWKQRTGDMVFSLGTDCSKRQVFAGSRDRSVYCFNFESRQNWKFETKEHVKSLAFNDLLLAAAGEEILRIRPEGIKFDINSFDSAVSSLDSFGGHSVASLEGGKLMVLDKNMEKLWDIQFQKNVVPVAIGKEMVFAGSETEICALRIEKELLWTYDAGGSVNALALSENRLFGGTFDGTVLCFDLDGNLLWKKEMGDAVLDLSASCNGDRIIVGLFEGNLVVLDGAGNEVSAFDLSGRVHAVGITKDGKNAVGGTSGGDIFFFEFIDKDLDVFYEILCRGDSHCGTFVSAVYTESCPKCGSGKIDRRIIKGVV